MAAKPEYKVINPIDLIGAGICECGYKRLGNYFGRCPKCLKYPHYIDCPVCGLQWK